MPRQKLPRMACPRCLRSAVRYEAGDGFELSLIRCGHCGDVVFEPVQCPLCGDAATRYAVSRSLTAVYACTGRCLPFELDAGAEGIILLPTHSVARDGLRVAVRAASKTGAALLPILISGRMVEDYRDRSPTGNEWA